MMRLLAASLTLLLLAPFAFGDVVILKGNDVPLTGRILEESESGILFQLKGLGPDSRFHIDRARIKLFWREDNSYFEYDRDRKGHREALAGIMGLRPEEVRAEEAGSAPPPVPPGRSSSEIRRQLFLKGWHRLESVVPHSLFLQIPAVLASLLALAGLFLLGARVAGFRRLRFRKSVLLSFVTHLLVVVAWTAPGTVLAEDVRPVVVAVEVLLWLVAVRLLAGEVLSRAFVLLSFSTATLLLLGGSIFSVLTVF